MVVRADEKLICVSGTRIGDSRFRRIGLTIRPDFSESIGHRFDAAELMQAIREAIADEFEIGVSTIQLLRPGSLPRTSSGKLRRNACRQAFLDGKLEVIREDSKKTRYTEQPSTSLANRIRRELATVLNVSAYSFDDDKPLARQGIVSLARV